MKKIGIYTGGNIHSEMIKRVFCKVAYIASNANMTVQKQININYIFKNIHLNIKPWI